MNCCTHPGSQSALLVLTLLGLTLGLTGPGLAQSRLAFKASVTGTAGNLLVIPKDPPIASLHLSIAGQSALLGPIKYTGYTLTQQNVDSVPISETGVGVITASNGDALFVEYRGAIHGSFVLTSDDTFVITGGRGRFVGATGNGTLSGMLDPIKGEVTLSWDGTIALPKK